VSVPQTTVPRRTVLLGLGTLAACASPSPNLYTLAAVEGRERRGAPALIELRAIGLARYLERAQIVRSTEDFRLDVLGNDWWGEPLDAMLARVTLQNLGQRLPGTTVFAESGAVHATADAILGVNVQRLDQARSGLVVLTAQVALSRRVTTTRSFTIQATPEGIGTPALVAAMSVALGELSDHIAGMLTAP
jgi:uncharacterized lipoprotein YmbA